MKEKLKQLNTTRGWLWCAIILSFFINIMFIRGSYMIFLSTDEQAPFAVAALLNGVDWSPTTSNMAYYSYGYAFVLAPLYWLTSSAKSLYQAAVVVNALMAAAIVPIAWSIGKKMNRKLSDKVMVVIAFCVAHYSCIIVRSHLALYEMTLIFVTWMLTWLYFSMEEKPKFWKYGLFGLLLIYGYMVHQRMLGIVLAGGLTLFIHFLKLLKEKKGKNAVKYFVMAVVAVAVIFIVHRYCKVLFKDSLWKGSATGDTNDFASLGNRFDKYLTRQGFNSLIKEIFGQLYYMGVATFLIGFVGAFCMLRTNLQTLLAFFSRKREMPEYSMSHLFILMAFGASFGISVMFMGGGTVRADYLIYGRYIEMTFGPILLMGLLHLVSSEEKPALFSLLSLLGLSVCSLITDYSFGNVRYVEFSHVSCIGVSIFHHDGYYHVYEGMLWAIGIFTVAFLLLRKGKERLQLLTLVLIAGSWTYIGGKMLREVVQPAQKCTYEYNWLLDARDEGTEDWPVYYTGPNGKTYEAPFIQYLMQDQVLQYIDISELHTLEGDHYVINKHSPVEMQEGYTLMGCSNEVFIYKHDGSERDDVIELPVEMFQSITGEHTEEGLVNSKPGFLMYGPYLTLIAGTYEVEIQYEVLSDSASGYFDMATGDVTHAAAYFAESECDENGIYTAKMRTCMIETWVRTEIRCYVESGQIRILGAKISWVDDMIDVPLSLYTTDLGDEDEFGVTNTAPGTLFAGPYITWYQGNYTIRIQYDVLSDDLEGSFAIYSDKNLLDEAGIAAGGNMGVSELTLTVGSEPMKKMDLQCEVTSGQIRITNVTILREMEE